MVFQGYKTNIFFPFFWKAENVLQCLVDSYQTETNCGKKFLYLYTPSFVDYLNCDLFSIVSVKMLSAAYSIFMLFISHLSCFQI